MYSMCMHEEGTANYTYQPNFFSNIDMYMYCSLTFPFLPLQIIDGELYNVVRNSYELYSKIEMDSCSAVKAEFEDLREQVALVREVNPQEVKLNVANFSVAKIILALK